MEQDPELRDEMEETLAELFGYLEGSFPDKVIPPGRNPAVDCIRLTLDPINSEHRPLAFYLVLSTLILLISGRISPSSLHVWPLPSSRIYLLSQRVRCTRRTRGILVPSAFISKRQLASIDGHPRRRFRPLPDLVRHKPCFPSHRSSNLHPRPQKRQHASPPSNILPKSPRNNNPNKPNPRPSSPARHQSNLLRPLTRVRPHSLDPQILPRSNCGTSSR